MNPTPGLDIPVERLAAMFHQPLLRFLTRMTRCRYRAEDLAQLAWVKLIQARSAGACSCTSEADWRAYLFTVARNSFLDEYTRKHAATRTCTVDPVQMQDYVDDEATASRPDQEAERQESVRLLRLALDQLPDEQRKVIELWVQGTSIRDMTTACNAPRDTVLSRKKYAFARLRSTAAVLRAAPT